MAKKRWKKKERIEKERVADAVEKGKNWTVIVGAVVLLLIIGYSLLGSQSSGPPETPSASIAINGNYRVISSMPSTHVPGRVTLIEFFDFTCSHCYDFHREIWPLLEEKYGERLVLVDLGLPLRQSSIPALEAYEIARELGKGDEMKDALFVAFHEKKEDISSTDVLTSIAVDVGLDEKAFTDELSAHTKASKIDENRRLGNSYGLKGTPTFVVDGNLMVTDNSLANLETIIDSVLEAE